MSTTEQITDREQWLALRRTGIGASEAAAALGVCPFKSAFELWSEKTGVIQPDDLSENEAVEFGLRLEKPICESFAERTGRAVKLWKPFDSVQHPDYPWLRCTPDATQFATSEESAGFDWMLGVGDLQVKTTSAWNQKSYDEEGPPLNYQVQCQVELAVMGWDWGTLVVLIGGQRLRWFDFRRNQPFIDAMIPALKEFWDRVENNDPPPPDGSKATTRALAKLYQVDNGGEIALPPESVEWDRELIEVKAQLKTLTERKDLLENQLKAAIGEATVGLLPAGGGYSFKTQERKGYTVAPTTFRTLRRIGK